jgi:D-sedoheptulose 7-phosphate isomerase
MKKIKSIFQEHNNVLKETEQKLNHTISNVCQLTLEILNSGNKILLFGNGGSASDSQHIAAEFVGRFKSERISLPAISLNTDTSIITAIGNDYGYENIFSRQLESLAIEGDIIFAFSTSGNSSNIIEAVKYIKYKTKNIKIVLFTGNKKGSAEKYADFLIDIPSSDTARIQEMHILIGHIICEYIDGSF